MVTDLENYLFDLRGYLHLEEVLTGDEVKDLNDCLDAIPPLEPGDWYGHVHAHTYGTIDGLNLQQIYEAGEPFERMIDHPAWIEKVKHFVGGEGTFDYAHGPLFIDENFANFRQPGEAIGLHSGGYPPIMRNQFRYHRGRYMCGQINILVALTDIGPGDGGTMLIPGSHKVQLHASRLRPASHETRRRDRRGHRRRGRVPHGQGRRLALRRWPLARLGPAPKRGHAPDFRLSLRTLLGQFPPRLPPLGRAVGAPDARAAANRLAAEAPSPRTAKKGY